MELKTGKMRFSRSIIEQAVAEVELGVSRKEICKKYGMAYNTLGEWVTRYASKDFQLNYKKTQITSHQKRSIVRAVQEGRLTIQEANIKYHLRGRDTIKRWLRKLKDDALPTDMEQHPIDRPQNNSSLEEQLSAANLKVLALETMIDLAEEDLKIEIRKKSGAKQSPK